MKTKNVLATILAGALIQGCGKSDPTADYKLNGVPITPKTEKNQSIYAAVFNISLVNNQQAPAFFEGETTEVQLKLNILDDEIKSGTMTIDASTQPSGSTLTQSKDDPTIFTFRWTPAVGSVQGNSDAKKISFTARPVGAPAIMANFYATYDLNIVVERTQVIPKVVGVDLPQVTNEGTDQVLKIRVQDSAHSAANQPQIQIVSYTGERNDENHKFDWAAKVTPNQPLVSGPDKDGVYTFSYTMSLKGQTLPLPPVESNPKKVDANASIVNLCFSVVAISNVSNLQSQPQPECTRVQFAAQPPVAYFDGDPDGVLLSNDVVAGQPATINFEVKTPNSRGDIQKTSAAFVNFASDPAGKPAVNEIAKGGGAVPPGASADRFYQLTWTPSCKASGSYVVRMRFTTVLDNQKKYVDIQRKLNIASKAAACDVPAVPVAPVQKPAAPAAKVAAAKK